MLSLNKQNIIKPFYKYKDLISGINKKLKIDKIVKDFKLNVTNFPKFFTYGSSWKFYFNIKFIKLMYIFKLWNLLKKINNFRFICKLNQIF